MKLHQVNTLVALADAGSIRAAARMLRLSQPALTKSIGQLERDLNAALVQRSAHGTQFTAIGKALLARARAIDNELRRAREEVAQLIGSYQGLVAIGVSPAPALTIVPAALGKFRRLYPSVRVRIVEGLYPLLAPLLREGSLDFLIGALPPETLPKALVAEHLYDNGLVVAARTSHPLAGKVRRLAELAESEWATAGPLSAHGTVVEEVFAELRLPPPRIAVQAESIHAVQAILPATDLFAMLPEQVFDACRAHRIEPLALRDRIRPARIGFLRRADALLTPAARALVDCIRREVRK